METEKFKLSNLFDGFVIPLLLVLLIAVIAIYLNPSGSFHILGNTSDLGSTIAIIFTQGFPKMVVLGIPLVLGLLWNKWAGGAAGFITGGMYYVAGAGLYTGYYAGAGGGYNFYGDISMLFYLVNAVIIGYMAGALNNRSTNFKRMLGAGLTSAIITAVIQTFFDYNFSLQPSRTMAQNVWGQTPAYAFTLAFIPSILLGVVVPIIGKVMTWYGIQPQRH